MSRKNPSSVWYHVVGRGQWGISGATQVRQMGGAVPVLETGCPHPLLKGSGRGRPSALCLGRSGGPDLSHSLIFQENFEPLSFKFT